MRRALKPTTVALDIAVEGYRRRHAPQSYDNRTRVYFEALSTSWLDSAIAWVGRNSGNSTTSRRFS